MEASDLQTRLARFFQEMAAPGVMSVYLFGSHAAGRVHRQSDVDIAVLLSRATYPATRDRFEERVRLTSELIAALHVNAIDLVVLNDAPPVLARRDRHGRTLRVLRRCCGRPCICARRTAARR